MYQNACKWVFQAHQKNINWSKRKKPKSKPRNIFLRQTQKCIINQAMQTKKKKIIAKIKEIETSPFIYLRTESQMVLKTKMIQSIKLTMNQNFRKVQSRNKSFLLRITNLWSKTVNQRTQNRKLYNKRRQYKEKLWKLWTGFGPYQRESKSQHFCQSINRFFLKVVTLKNTTSWWN